LYFIILAYNGTSEIVRQKILANFPQLQGHNFRIKKAASEGANNSLVPIDDSQSVPSVSTLISNGCDIIYIVPDNHILPDDVEVNF
jgi:hypothetical protein